MSTQYAALLVALAIASACTFTWSVCRLARKEPNRPYSFDAALPPRPMPALTPLADTNEPSLLEIRNNGQCLYRRFRDGRWQDGRVAPQWMME